MVKVIIFLVLLLIYILIKKKPKFEKLRFETFQNNPAPTDLGEKVDFINFEFITLNPNFANKEIKKGISWQKHFENELCGLNLPPSPSLEVNKCSCLEIGDSVICGKDYKDYVFQCPYKCADCGECHKNDKSKPYYDCKNKVKCKKYKDRIDFLKKYSLEDTRKFIEEFDKDGKLSLRVALQRSNLIDIVFNINRFNDFIVGEEFLMRLIIKKEQKDITNFKLKNVYLNGKKKEFNIFYGDNKEIYLFIIPSKNDIGNNISLKLNGYYMLKNNKNNFYIEKEINIFKNNVEPPKIEKKETTLEVNSYLDDSYLNNYIGESKLVSPHLLRNPVIINEVKNRDLGEFKKEKMIDNPETWKMRADINRPWISTYSYINEDIFRKYNLDKREKQYMRMVEKTDKILLGNEYQGEKSKFNIDKNDIMKILKQVKNEKNSFVSLIDLTDKLSIRILNIMKKYKISTKKFKSELTPQTKLIIVQDPLKKASMESQIPIITYQDVISNFEFLYEEPKK